MNARWVAALNEALERVEKGQSPEAALADMVSEGRIAEADLHHVAPELLAAAGLRAADKPALRADFRDQLKREVVAMAASGAAGRKARWRRDASGRRSARPIWARMALRAVPLALALLFSLGSIVAISADSLPGDLLYPLQPISRTVMRGLERVWPSDSAPPRADAGPAADALPASGAGEGEASDGESAAAVDSTDRSRGQAPGVENAALGARPTAVLRADRVRTALGTPTQAIVASVPSLVSPIRTPMLTPPASSDLPTGIPQQYVATATLPPEPPRAGGDDPDPEPKPSSTSEPSLTPAPTATGLPPTTLPAATATAPASTATLAPPSETPTAVAAVCGGQVQGALRDLDGNLVTISGLTVVASITGSLEPFAVLGIAEAVDGRYTLDLEDRLCAGQVEQFYLVAIDSQGMFLVGWYATEGFAGAPAALDVKDRERWGEPEVTIFGGSAAGPGAQPLLPCPDDQALGRVSGQVLDASGSPAPFASVAMLDIAWTDDLIDRHRFVDADAQGRYQLSDVCLGRYHVLAMVDGAFAGPRFGFWDPDDDGEPNVLTIASDAPDHAEIDITADTQDWPELLPPNLGWP